MSRRPSILTAVIAAALLLPGAMPASASPRVPPRAAVRTSEAAPAAKAPAERLFSITRKDGNDVKGPLDLASMKISRGKSQDTVSFTTFGRVPNDAIDADHGNFVILIDTNDDRKYEYGQYLFFYGGKLRGLLINLKTDNPVDRTVPTSRTGPRSFRQVIQRSKINSPGTYRFAIFGVYGAAPCGRVCIDGIPNRYPLIPLDHRLPSMGWDHSVFYSTDETADLTSPIEFHVSDDKFGTGIKGWTVQTQEIGGTGWTTVEEGRSLHPTVLVPGEEGKAYLMRVVVEDKQKNRRISSTENTIFPFDDRNIAISYGGVTQQLEDVSAAFLGTTTTVGQNATATFTFNGNFEFCLLTGPTTGATATATVERDGIEIAETSIDGSTPARSRSYCSASSSGVHMMKFTVTTAEPFVIDGFIVT